MDLDDARSRFDTDGFAVLPAYLSADELAPALGEIDQVFPTPDGFHDRTDERWTRFVEDEFDGIDTFPFASTELSLLAMHARVVELAAHLLGTPDLRMYSAESWAKYTGATDYDQWLHRDYLNHTTLVPSDDPAFRQLEMFVWLVDVDDDLGAPRLVSRRRTADRGARPNWLPRTDGRGDDGGWAGAEGVPEVYAEEVSGSGPAGTVVAFETGTFHRGTALSRPRGARYSMHLSFRPAGLEWGTRQGWADRSHLGAWYAMVGRATPQQLALLGVPLPGHSFWTERTIAGMSERYPGLDLDPWRAALGTAGDQRRA
jgi:hypothetical protein